MKKTGSHYFTELYPNTAIHIYTGQILTFLQDFCEDYYRQEVI